ncbi:MAG TPA: dihydroorotate dehydrogenase-like protein [Caldithrix abyssi]|uniref:Dihydroorotate dehydrogenase-like protein n=1 Tax=Caldithrix abyssi TaxID=187145 RepID=A0A7V4WVD8_CALAY|nr:dihydroorotate dehydrogenase-like protein [Caldithrix abyssi]
MDLSTTYMGFKLKNPLIPSASPLSANIDKAKELEDAGAAAIVMYSLFEEQINQENEALDTFLSQGSESFAEAMAYFPQPESFANAEAEEYLEQVSKLKEALDIPVIGSLNGVSAGGWMKYAKKIQEAGADGLELNIFFIPTDPDMTATTVEEMYIENLKTVKQHVSIPVSVKMGPFFSSMANMAKQLDDAGANALVLFNRLYQPDIDLEELEVVTALEPSTSYELRLPLRWLAILYGRLQADLAVSRGIHSAQDVLKAIMAGADVTQMTSVLLQKGPAYLKTILQDLINWMEEHEYESIEQMKGSMSYKSIAQPAAYTRANYMKTLQSIR